MRHPEVYHDLKNFRLGDETPGPGCTLEALKALRVLTALLKGERIKGILNEALKRAELGLVTCGPHYARIELEPKALPKSLEGSAALGFVASKTDVFVLTRFLNAPLSQKLVYPRLKELGAFYAPKLGAGLKVFDAALIYEGLEAARPFIRWLADKKRLKIVPKRGFKDPRNLKLEFVLEDPALKLSHVYDVPLYQLENLSEREFVRAAKLHAELGALFGFLSGL